MRRTLNAIGALLFISIGLVFVVGWLTGGQADTQRESGTQYAQFIAAAFCLSVGTVLGWRAARKPINLNETNNTNDNPITPLESKSDSQS